MKKNILSAKWAALALSGVLSVGCTQDTLDDINTRTNRPTDAAARFIITELLTSTAFSVVGGDFALYSAIYVEHETGVHGQMYDADRRQAGAPTSATTYNNVWQSAYSNILYAKLAINKCKEEGGADFGNAVTQGIAQTMLAYNAAVITDVFGDTPFKEAGERLPDGAPKYMQPAIDKQEDIYTEIDALLTSAIANFALTDKTGVGAKDIIYGGNKAKWAKAAYGLKARYAMRRYFRNQTPATLEDVVRYADLSFADASEELKYAAYDGDARVNPIMGAAYSRDFFGASQSLLQKFVDLDDPRADNLFMNWSTESLAAADEVDVAPNGTANQVQGSYAILAANYAPSAPTQLLSYHEVQFLKAEALVRLGGRDAEAKVALKNAITAAFASQEREVNDGLGFVRADGSADLGAAVAGDYFANSVEARFAAEPLKEVMVQKYLAFAGSAGESIEAYNDYRRLQALGGGEELFITLANPVGAAKFPLRFSYGNADVTANPAIKAAYGDGTYVYTDKVWWAGGTR